MDLFTYLMAKKGHNTHRDLFSYLLGKNAGGSGTYTTFSGTSLNISNTLQAKIKNIALEGNTSQDGTPTPDTPIPIKVVTGEQNVTIQNKNLFDTNNLVQGYISDTIIDNRTNATRTNAILLKAGTYTYSFKCKNSTWIKMVKYANATATTGTFIFNLQSANYSKTFTLSEDTYVRFGFDTKLSNILANATIQIEFGPTASDYVEHQEQTYPLSLGNIELAKIGNYKDYIFKNATGSPYYNSELDLNEWYLHKEIVKITYSGSEVWYTYNRNIDSVSRQVFCRRNDTIYNSSATTIKSNYFVNKGNTPTGNYQICNNPGRYYNIDVTYFEIEDVQTFKDWLAEHNLIIYGIRVTPTNTKITDTTLIQQLENINNNARSYSDTTIIICSSASDDNEVIGFSGDIKVTSVGLGNSLNTSLLSSNLQEETNIDDIQEEPNLDDVNEIEDIEQNDEPIEEEIIEEEVS